MPGTFDEAVRDAYWKRNAALTDEQDPAGIHRLGAALHLRAKQVGMEQAVREMGLLGSAPGLGANSPKRSQVRCWPSRTAIPVDKRGVSNEDRAGDGVSHEATNAGQFRQGSSSRRNFASDPPVNGNSSCSGSRCNIHRRA